MRWLRSHSVQNYRRNATAWQRVIAPSTARDDHAMRPKSRESSITAAALLSALAGVLAVGLIILVMIGAVGTSTSVHEPAPSTASAPPPLPSGTTGQSPARCRAPRPSRVAARPIRSEIRRHRPPCCPCSRDRHVYRAGLCRVTMRCSPSLTDRGADAKSVRRLTSSERAATRICIERATARFHGTRRRTWFHGTCQHSWLCVNARRRRQCRC